MSRKRAAIKRAGYEHAELSRLADAAFRAARLEYGRLGVVQQRALISCPVRPVVGLEQADGIVFPLRVRCSLQLKGMLEAGEQWALTPWGALVRQAGGTCEGDAGAVIH